MCLSGGVWDFNPTLILTGSYLTIQVFSTCIYNFPIFPVLQLLLLYLIYLVQLSISLHYLFSILLQLLTTSPFLTSLRPVLLLVFCQKFLCWKFMTLCHNLSLGYLKFYIVLLSLQSSGSYTGVQNPIFWVLQFQSIRNSENPTKEHALNSCLIFSNISIFTYFPSPLH